MLNSIMAIYASQCVCVLVCYKCECLCFYVTKLILANKILQQIEKFLLILLQFCHITIYNFLINCFLQIKLY